MKVGEVLKELRYKKKITVSRIASAAGMDVRNYYKLEQKEDWKILMSTFMRVLDAMGATLRDVHDVIQRERKKQTTRSQPKKRKKVRASHRPMLS